MLQTGYRFHRSLCCGFALYTNSVYADHRTLFDVKACWAEHWVHHYFNPSPLWCWTYPFTCVSMTLQLLLFISRKRRRVLLELEINRVFLTRTIQTRQVFNILDKWQHRVKAYTVRPAACVQMHLRNGDAPRMRAFPRAHEALVDIVVVTTAVDSPRAVPRRFAAPKSLDV
ncbi:hypothetical protein EVAR_20992_1 [Eumeta japonica]|uniref:Uncharacterized protein n=1 Tax=Eumeta variegata TaxID=151549 RepID=A0A4C1V517_EUMVA|nr:hypothetical protein EVAR_20992_1 [Eumeta japonica]